MHEGVFTAWKSRKHFDIYFARHAYLSKETWEIIAYCAEIGVEASRIYISYDAACKNIPAEEISKVVATEKENRLRHKQGIKDFDPKSVIEDYSRKYLVEYLLHRIDSPRI
jgi:hypothetical protein